jgi:hypothetical protein
MYINISPQHKDRLFKFIIRSKYTKLSLESQNWIDDLLKKSQTSQVINKILIWWREGDIEKGYFYSYLSNDKYNLSFFDRFKFWVITIIIPMCTGVAIPSPLRKDFDLFRKALTLASIFLVEKSWYKEITDNTAKE